MKKSLRHIAIIMDGNGRWAAKHNLPIAAGHEQGAIAARKILLGCLKLKIPYLTLYTFSSENWNREPDEVETLLKLFKHYLSKEIPLLLKNKVKVKIIGNKAKFSQDIIDLIDLCEEKTKDNNNLCLQIAVSYGSREEIVLAQKKLCADVISGKIELQGINEETFLNYLFTKDAPDPDLLIRTSGEHRISNFLLWQLAYTELYFTKTLWPDFNLTHLRKAIANYYKRERRYGLSRKTI